MDRVLRGSGGSVSVQLYDVAGDPADAGVGAGTARVYDSADVEQSGSPFTPAHTSGTGLYTVALPAALTKLDTYRVLWTFPDTSTRTTYFEMVGGFLFTAAEVQAFAEHLAAVPVAQIVALREVVEERFAKVTGVSFTRRGERIVRDGTGTDRLLLPRMEVGDVIEASFDGTAQTAADFQTYPFGLVRATSGIFPAGYRNVSLLIEHGYVVPPAPIHRAGIQFMRHLLTQRPLETDRATAAMGEGFGYRLTIAGRDGFTGLPDVDAVLEDYRIEGFA